MARTAAIILAAGMGSRMKSSLAKVLHPFLGRPMLFGPLDAALRAGADEVVVVVGHQADAVREAVTASFPGWPIQFALQAEQRGTGHAVACALPLVGAATRLLILYGDTPLLSASTLGHLLHVHAEGHHALTLSSFMADDPSGYGRIVRDAAGHVTAIVEHRDATPAELALREVNAGPCVADAATLRQALADIAPHNAQGELYLTDAAAWAANHGKRVASHILKDPDEVRGVNTRGQLAELEEVALTTLREAWMARGVSIRNPSTVRIDAAVEIGEDTVLGPQVQLLGRTRVGRGCELGAGVVLTDCELGDGVHVLPYSVGDRARIASLATVGPFAHLRPGTELGERTRIGNFVEVKKSRFGPGSKASHLAYIGDAEVGRDVNIGAGTITCNYDGVDKHQTVIEDGVFIGSDTQLVAPVRVGRDAVIGAGTTVTRDVPAGSLAVSRTPQSEVAGYFERRVRPRLAAKKGKPRDEAPEASPAVGPVTSPLSRRAERPESAPPVSDDPSQAPPPRKVTHSAHRKQH
jgi:bifunctional UDP-N-acetylglucosamine pyrophosphorylase/glucosamine-1-phosphate N-acetyltransferase